MCSTSLWCFSTQKREGRKRNRNSKKEKGMKSLDSFSEHTYLFSLNVSLYVYIIHLISVGLHYFSWPSLFSSMPLRTSMIFLPFFNLPHTITVVFVLNIECYSLKYLMDIFGLNRQCWTPKVKLVVIKWHKIVNWLILQYLASLKKTKQNKTIFDFSVAKLFFDF